MLTLFHDANRAIRTRGAEGFKTDFGRREMQFQKNATEKIMNHLLELSERLSRLEAQFAEALPRAELAAVRVEIESLKLNALARAESAAQRIAGKAIVPSP